MCTRACFIVALDHPVNKIDLSYIRKIFAAEEGIETKLLVDTLSQTPTLITVGNLPSLVDGFVADESCPWELIKDDPEVLAHDEGKPDPKDISAYRLWLEARQDITDKIHRSHVSWWLNGNTGKWIYKYTCSEKVEQGSHWDNVPALRYVRV